MHEYQLTSVMTVEPPCTTSSSSRFKYLLLLSRCLQYELFHNVSTGLFHWSWQYLSILLWLLLKTVFQVTSWGLGYHQKGFTPRIVVALVNCIRPYVDLWSSGLTVVKPGVKAYLVWSTFCNFLIITIRAQRKHEGIALVAVEIIRQFT